MLGFIRSDIMLRDVFSILLIPIEFNQPSHRGITYFILTV
jgi:hypothetical protein